jgi:hypothetical protein
MANPSMRGKFVWHELLTSDTKAAAAFYRKVVGWKVEGWDQDPSYQMFVAKSGPMGGLMILPDEAKAMGAPPNWMTYIGTPDVDATARQSEEIGGRVLRAPDDIPNMGRFAILQDPQGASFAIYQSGSATPEPGAPGLGEASWHELVTSDHESAFGFYASLFGWQKTDAMDMGAMGTYQMFGTGGTSVGGMYDKPASMAAPPHWLPYFLVADTRKAVETIKVLGGQILSGPMQVPGGDWVATGLDPQGVLFAVHSKAAVAKAAPAAKPAKQAAAKKAAAKKPAAKKTARKPAKKKAAKKAARKPAKKAAKKAARRPAKKAAKKAARKPAKKKGGAKKKK